MFSPPSPSAQNWFKGSLDQAVAKAKTENKLVIIDFFSAGSGGCKLLGEQFYENPKFHSFQDKSFILFRADSDTEIGDAVFKKFAIRATPTTIILGPDGSEVDWFVGYGPPPENFQAKLEKVIAGTDTFKAVNDAYAKNPNDAALAFKLARKWS